MAELSGWKAIAAHLKKSERMCRYYLTWSPPLPVYQFGGSGEVVARTEEIDMWRSSHLRHCAATSVASRCRRLPADRRKVRKAKARRASAIAG